MPLDPFVLFKILILLLVLIYLLLGNKEDGAHLLSRNVQDTEDGTVESNKQS